MSTTYNARKKPVKQPVYNFVPPTEKKILAFSGKIGAGKTSCCNFITALALVHLIKDDNNESLAPYGAFVNVNGQLAIFDEIGKENVISLKPHSATAQAWLSTQLWPFIRLVSFADGLKEFCINMLGLQRELVYGNQEDKNQPSNIRWENLPYSVYVDCNGKISTSFVNHNGELFDEKTRKQVFLKNGFMSIREVLEQVGSEVIRKIVPDAHVNGLVNTINMSNTPFILVDDVRFLNEVKSIQSLQGKVIRLTRTTEENNKHESNTALNNVDDNIFDAVIDNTNLDMDQTFGILMEKMIELGFFEVINK